MNHKTYQAVQFACYLAREINQRRFRVAEIVGLCERLVDLARKHHRIQLNTCNGGKQRKGAREDCEANITTLCNAFRLKAIFSYDPRGSTVKVLVPSGATNDFNGTGICVPQ